MLPAAFHYFAIVFATIVVGYFIYFGLPDDFVINNCLRQSNEYFCDSMEECEELAWKSGEHDSAFDLVGDRDYCLWDQAVYAREPEKYCNAMEKDFMKEYCFEWLEWTANSKNYD